MATKMQYEGYKAIKDTYGVFGVGIIASLRYELGRKARFVKDELKVVELLGLHPTCASEVRDILEAAKQFEMFGEAGCSRSYKPPFRKWG